MGPATYESSQVKELDNLFTITTDGYQRTALYLHKSTNEAYVVVAFLDHIGGGYFERYLSVKKATASDADAVISCKNKYSYEVAYQMRNDIFDFTKMGKCFLVDGQRYRYMVYLMVDDLKIPAQEAMLTEDTVRIPETRLPSRKYERYLVSPGPFEHTYDLPTSFIKNVTVCIEKY